MNGSDDLPEENCMPGSDVETTRTGISILSDFMKSHLRGQDRLISRVL
ncbi:MAG: hypothetical protein ACI8XW_002754, partial [Gammaproteobacteria bacterium]